MNTVQISIANLQCCAEIGLDPNNQYEIQISIPGNKYPQFPHINLELIATTKTSKLYFGELDGLVRFGSKSNAPTYDHDTEYMWSSRSGVMNKYSKIHSKECVFGNYATAITIDKAQEIIKALGYGLCVDFHHDEGPCYYIIDKADLDGSRPNKRIWGNIEEILIVPQR